jgi:hypothetical protein
VKLDIRKDRPAIINTLTGLAFPPDTTRDMTAVYEGDIARTRVAQRKLHWKDVELSTDLIDLRKSLGWIGYSDEGTAYFLTHIYTPQAAQITLNLSAPHGQSFISGQLNGQALPQVKDRDQTLLDASKPLSLQPGWNELLIRRDIIWGAMDYGGSLAADPAILWNLKISGPAPAGN